MKYWKSFRSVLTLSGACALALAWVSCALPPVSLTTPEPVKVDVNVRLDVYQHGGKDAGVVGEAGGEAADGEETVSTDAAAIDERRRNRMGDIQTFKNSRLVGEDHTGLLEILNAPPGEYGTYVSETVEAENADRLALMRLEAEEEGIPLADVRARRAEDWRDRSFNGEWIEVPDGTGGHRWVRKGQES